MARLYFAKIAKNRKHLELLTLMQHAMHGKKQDIDKLIKELSKDG